MKLLGGVEGRVGKLRGISPPSPGRREVHPFSRKKKTMLGRAHGGRTGARGGKKKNAANYYGVLLTKIATEK